MLFTAEYWAPIEPFGPFLVEQSGVFSSALEDLSWFVRLLHKIYLPFIYASNKALSNQYITYRYIWTYESKLKRKFPKVLDLETCLLSEKAARRGLAGKGSHEYEEINSCLNYFYLLV